MKMRLVITDIQKLNGITPKNYFKATVISLFHLIMCCLGVLFFTFASGNNFLVLVKFLKLVVEHVHQ